MNAADAVQDMYDDAVNQVERISREFAALGDDLPEHLRGELGQTGEDFVDGLILAGLSNDAINEILDNDTLMDGLDHVAIANKYCTSQTTCNRLIPQTQPQTSASDTGLNHPDMLPAVTVTGIPQDATALQIGVTGLGKIQQEMDALLAVSPETVQAIEMAIGLATGGPIKVALSQAINYGIEKTVGNQIQQATTQAQHIAGSWIQGVTVDEFGQLVTEDQTAGNSSRPLGTSSTDTVDGVRLGSSIVGIVIGAAIARKGGEDGADNVSDSRGEYTGPYNSNKTREDLEVTHGAENVTSTTNPRNPVQTANSNSEKGIEVVIGAGGGKAVRIQYIDPVTGESKTANIPYNDRGLPIFDDHAKFTTTIDNSVSYKTQMKRATEDLRNAINDRRVDSDQYTARQLQDIQNKEPKISGYTWHHNGDTGNMQLVPTVVHDAAKHTGQNALSEGR